MGHSIELHMAEADRKLLMENLADLEGPWQEEDFKPHVSLAVIRQEAHVPALREIVHRLHATFAETELCLSSIGLFPGRRPVLYLGVAPTAQLMRYHQQTLIALKQIGVEPISYYLRDRWSPHVTLLTGLPSGQFTNIVKPLSRTAFTGSYRFAWLDLIEFHPAERLEHLALAP